MASQKQQDRARKSEWTIRELGKASDEEAVRNIMAWAKRQYCQTDAVWDAFDAAIERTREPAYPDGDYDTAHYAA